MVSFLQEGPVGLIARLVRAEAFNNEDLALPNANRVSFEFDCIDARLSLEEARAAIEDRGSRSSLAVLKILTTVEKFLDLTGVPEALDGQWFSIKLLPRGKKPGSLAWATSLGDTGYQESVWPAAGFLDTELRCFQ